MPMVMKFSAACAVPPRVMPERAADRTHAKDLPFMGVLLLWLFETSVPFEPDEAGKCNRSGASCTDIQRPETLENASSRRLEHNLLVRRAILGLKLWAKSGHAKFNFQHVTSHG
ncbi:protein of unknown function [Pseudomonas marincola]|uniref:Uncharacterized protein n=1 Tax=Pseudomonas marincola TaxID=437900 RepID=A0A8S2B2E8_9PSED|nr:protein of unknown function [Pseudomonas marincola]